MKTLRLNSSGRAILLNSRFFSRLPRLAPEALSRAFSTLRQSGVVVKGG
ncbi:hypothetical protein USDA257_c49240 [Sinorhizobium fredii USDA 257]|jgi:hypothetical protein|uniref:Uncharacterized protein n=1 Tax=Sinorhizobium fredii (strain USDA 257) TaxID=1185652 RepID=I3XC52_SINF2|nr:hypothetical protein USDA257_c49240 [Sinorhizobium fredii USDA 257]